MEKIQTLGWAASVSGVAGLLYFLTAARDIVVGDTPELITAAVTLGVPHAPGYPLFTMLGHLFSLLPFGPIPFRVNLLAVVCNALAVGTIYLTGFHLIRSRIAATVAAFLLAVNPIFWTWSLPAEVFPLNNLIAALLILCLIIWYEQPQQSAFLVMVFFLMGLGLTNHQTIILLAPAFYFILWQRREFLQTGSWLLTPCIIAFLVGLLPYVYVPWASAHHPPYNWGNVSSIRDLLALIMRRGYGGRLVATVGYSGGSAIPRIAALLASFGPLTGILTVLGAIRVYRLRRWYLWFTAAGFIFAGPFFVWITNLNIATAPSALFVLQRFFLLSHVVVAPLAAFGVLQTTELIGRLIPGLRAWGLHLVSASCLVAALAVVVTNYRRIDQSRDFVARHFGEDVFATIDPGSVFLVNGDAFVFPLIYLQNVEKMAPNTTVVPLPLLRADWYVRQLRQSHPDLVIPFDRYDKNLKTFVDANGGRKIYIIGTTADDQSLDASYWPRQHGLLTTIEPKSRTFPLQQMINENEQLLRRYHPPAPDSIRADTFEIDILNAYASPAFRIGSDCERASLKNEARDWYERALAINPHLSEVREALAQLGANIQD
jgi:4-amino-4-deoxy-L-arabinose transferase-like glycosyltransferase